MNKESDMIMESASGGDFEEVLRANRVPLTLIGIGVACTLAPLFVFACPSEVDDLGHGFASLG